MQKNVEAKKVCENCGTKCKYQISMHFFLCIFCLCILGLFRAAVFQAPPFIGHYRHCKCSVTCWLLRCLQAIPCFANKWFPTLFHKAHWPLKKAASQTTTCSSCWAIELGQPSQWPTHWSLGTLDRWPSLSSPSPSKLPPIRPFGGWSVARTKCRKSSARSIGRSGSTCPPSLTICMSRPKSLAGMGCPRRL